MGTVIGSMTLGSTLGFLGSIVVPRHEVDLAITIAGIAGSALALCDLGVGGASTPTLRRQTQPMWWRVFGRVPAMFLWGLDLGLGFTTIRVSSLYWMVALIIVALASPLKGAAILSGYGFALALNLGLGTLMLEHKGDRSSVCVLRLHHSLKMGLAGILFMWSMLLITEPR